jgi:hypothetical protein
MSARLLNLVRWKAAAATLALATGDALAQGCAMCQASLPGADDPLARGFNYSIFVFLGATYGLVGLVGGWLAIKYWRAGARRRSSRVLPFQSLRKEEHP